MKYIWLVLKYVCYIVVLISVLFAIIISYNLFKGFTYFPSVIELIGKIVSLQDYGNIGNLTSGLIGSLFTIAAFFILLITLIEQKDTFRKQQFESKFFELLKLHRANVAEMEIELDNMFEKGIFKGRKVFVRLYDEFFSIYNSVSLERNNQQINNFQERIMQDASFAYILLFYGIDDSSIERINNYISQNQQYKYLEIYFQFIHKLKQNNPLNPLFYTSRQDILSHYFRHLFQTIKFIDRQTFLTDKEKYFYAKTLRAQLSNFELAIFFFNSLSPLGASWELKMKKYKVNLITKYKFIKNIPIGFTKEINPKAYYPKIAFEDKQ